MLTTYADRIDFVTAEVAYASAHMYLPGVLRKRGLSPDLIGRLVQTEVVDRLPQFVTSASASGFAHREKEARERLVRRDEDDWPFVALALQLDCPIWTEDRDFFGCGVATCTTDRVEIYLRADPPQS